MQSYVELEKKHYHYIVVDSKNETSVLMPIIGGDEIGTDNTCKALIEVKKFWGLQSGSPSVIDSIEHYIHDLNNDIDFLRTIKTPDKATQIRLDEKLKRRNQLLEWLGVIESVMLRYQHAILQSKFPNEVNLLLAKKSQNVVRINLAPRAQDNVSAFEKKLALFSLHRNPQRLGTELREMLNESKLIDKRKSKTSKNKLIENSINAFKIAHPTISRIDDEKSLIILKKIIAEEYQKLLQPLNINFDPKALDTLANPTHGIYLANYKTLNMISSFEDEGATLEEAATSVLSATIENDITLNLDTQLSPFSEVHIDANNEIELTSIRCQLYLAIANAHFYVKNGNTLNFGATFEQNKYLRLLLNAAIKDAIEKDKDIETALFDFLKDSYGIFKLDKNKDFTHEHQKAISKTFREHYRAVKDSPHFDEFLLFLPELKDGDGYSHNGKIAFSLSSLLAVSTNAQDRKTYAATFQGTPSKLPAKITSPSHRLSTDNQIQGIKVDDPVEGLDVKSMLSNASLLPSYYISLMTKTAVGKESDEKKGAMVRWYTLLNPLQKSLFKEHKDWQVIQDGILSKLRPEEMEDFCLAWKIPPVLPVKHAMAELIYSKIVSQNTEKNPLLGLNPCDKLKMAFQLEGIVVTSVRHNEMGGFIVTFADSKTIQEKVMPLYKEAFQYFHISRPMAKSIYLEAAKTEPEKPPQKPSPSFLSQLTSKKEEFYDEREDSVQDVKTEEPIVTALKTLEFKSVNVKTIGRNGYLLKVQDQKDINRIQEIYQNYYETLPAIQLTLAQCQNIFTAAGIPFPGLNPDPEMIRQLLSLAFGYNKLNLLVVSMDLIPMPDGKIEVRCVVDDSEQALARIAHYLKIEKTELTPAIHPSKDPSTISGTFDQTEVRLADLKMDLPSLVLTPAMQEIIFAAVSIIDEYHLLPFSNGMQLQEALSFFKLNSESTLYDETTQNYKVFFKNEAEKKAAEDYFIGKTPTLHLTRSMTRSLRMEAKLPTVTKPLTDEEKIASIFDACQKLILPIEKIGYYPECKWNGYKITADDPKTLTALRKIHQKRFNSLTAIKLTQDQCRALCTQAIIEIKSDKNGLQKALTEAIQFKKLNIPTAFLEITSDGGARLVVEPDIEDKGEGNEGLRKIASLLKVSTDSLKTQHPKDDRAEMLKAVQDSKVAPSHFPIAMHLEKKDFSVTFTFQEEKTADSLYTKLKKTHSDYIKLKDNTIQFSAQACKDKKVREFLNLFHYTNEVALKAASYLAYRLGYTSESSLFTPFFNNPQAELEKEKYCKGAFQQVIEYSLQKPKIKNGTEKQSELREDIQQYTQILGR